MTESPIFLKICEIEVALCTKKMTKAYGPLFRNTQENRDNGRKKIFEIYNVPYLAGTNRSWCVAEQLKMLIHDA